MLKLFSILLVLKFVSGYTSNGKEYTDCSDKFKNRMASFEYQYYSGNYVYPRSKEYVGIIASDENSIKSESLFQWHLHEAYSQRVNGEMIPQLYMESMEFPNYYLSDVQTKPFDGSSIGLKYRTYKDRECSSKNWGDKISIFCPNSCIPFRTDKDTEIYESCQIQVVARAPEHGECTHWTKMLYADHKYWLYGYRSQISGRMKEKSEEGWFDFRIITPKTATYWRQIDHRENCDSTEPIKGLTTIKQSISKTSQHTNAKTLELTIGASKALKFLDALVPEVKTSFSWESTNIEEMAKSTEHIIGEVKIKPGYKWIVYQWVGEAAYFKLATVRVKTCDVPCGDVADENIDAYCHTDDEVERQKLKKSNCNDNKNDFIFKADCTGTKVEFIPNYEALKESLCDN